MNNKLTDRSFSETVRWGRLTGLNREAIAPCRTRKLFPQQPSTLLSKSGSTWVEKCWRWSKDLTSIRENLPEKKKNPFTESIEIGRETRDNKKIQNERTPVYVVVFDRIPKE